MFRLIVCRNRPFGQPIRHLIIPNKYLLQYIRHPKTRVTVIWLSAVLLRERERERIIVYKFQAGCGTTLCL